MKEPTPMMAQYRALKSRYPDALLFFRLGDFYEMFFEDAETGSRELGITLTSRVAGQGSKAPMCGVPHHSVDDYIKVLIEKGYKVAICDQMEDPALAKGLVRRDVVRVITPGTYWEGSEPSSTSYIAAVNLSPDGETSAIAACDLSTGEVLVAEFEPGQGGRRSALEELARLQPRECVVPEPPGAGDSRDMIAAACPRALLSEVSTAGESLGTSFPDFPATENRPAARKALSNLFLYLKTTQMTDLGHLKAPVFYLEEGYLEIDPSTRRNLELFERLQGGKEGSLVWVLDRACTSMGSRLLRQWIERPLRDEKAINARLDAVQTFFKNSALRHSVRRSLARVKDLERLMTRIAYNSANARDLVAIAASLEAIPAICDALGKELPGDGLLSRILERLDPVPQISQIVRKAIVDEPPVSVTSGGLIREGYDRDIDQLRDLAAGGKQWILDLEARERERTGVKSLKVGYNRVFGYYIEVTRANLAAVPEDYIRKQTLATAERFITPELREKEAAVLGAEEKLNREEQRIFTEIRDFVASHMRRVQSTARAVAELDVLASLAEVAVSGNYCRPEVIPGVTLRVKDGRHPVLEQVVPPGTYVPNDLNMDPEERILIITGPNMGGKSTYCRQAALITIMAQMGSFVPAKSATIGCADKVFARVGAYDDLVLGQSTFMVEMAEVSRILMGATEQSLVILDEIGRGTSTFDGLSVAWAVVEHLAGEPGSKPGPRALVATHYRELTLLSDLRPSVRNYCVSVKRSGDTIVFLRRVVRGVAEGSFGIEVSAMAGLPQSVVSRAREILSGLEAEARRGSKWRQGILGKVASRSAGPLLMPGLPGQASLFDSAPEVAATAQLSDAAAEVLKELEALDVERMSPLEALQKLYEVKKTLTGKEE